MGNQWSEEAMFIRDIKTGGLNGKGVSSKSDQDTGISDRHSLMSGSQVSLSSNTSSSSSQRSLGHAQNNLNTLQYAPTAHGDRKQPKEGSTREVDALKREVRQLRHELARSKETMRQMAEREQALKDRLSEQAQKQIQKSSHFEDLSLGDNRPTQLVHRYGNIYSQSRLDAFDALDELPEISEFDELKGKLLFSIIVLANRAAQQWLMKVRSKLNSLLSLDENRDTNVSGSSRTTDPLKEELDETLKTYLRKSVDRYDLTACIHDVCNQVWATLYDYPSLKECTALQDFIEECVRLSWALSNQNPPLVIDFENRPFSDDFHERFHTSDPDSTRIRSMLWPALREGTNGPCLHKAVVIT